MKHPLALLVSLPLATMPLGGLAQAADKASAADRAFVAKVSQGGMFEVMAGKLAVDQGQAQDIKDQGATEAHDHQGVNDKLKSIASSLDIDVASSLNDMFQNELDALKAKSGLAFDRTYLSDMETLHAKDGAAFAVEAKSGTSRQLRDFAAETHPIVERHIGELKAVGPGGR